MKQKELNNLDPMNNWIKEAGMESLGPEFHISVLKKIETLPKVNPSYTPVISSKGWKLIFGFIALIFGTSVFFLPPSEDTSSLFDKIPSFQIPKFIFTLNNFGFQAPDFSPQFLMSILVFFILGFIMIVGTIRQNKIGI